MAAVLHRTVTQNVQNGLSSAPELTSFWGGGMGPDNGLRSILELAHSYNYNDVLFVVTMVTPGTFVLYHDIF